MKTTKRGFLGWLIGAVAGLVGARVARADELRSKWEAMYVGPPKTPAVIDHKNTFRWNGSMWEHVLFDNIKNGDRILLIDADVQTFIARGDAFPNYLEWDRDNKAVFTDHDLSWRPYGATDAGTVWPDADQVKKCKSAGNEFFPGLDWQWKSPTAEK